MRIYMQVQAGDDKPPRFYHLHLQEDLLQGWSLIKESGYQGSPGRLTKEYFPQREQAMEALIKARDRQLKRGYCVVFTQGDGPAHV